MSDLHTSAKFYRSLFKTQLNGKKTSEIFPSFCNDKYIVNVIVKKEVFNSFLAGKRF